MSTCSKSPSGAVLNVNTSAASQIELYRWIGDAYSSICCVSAGLISSRLDPRNSLVHIYLISGLFSDTILGLNGTVYALVGSSAVSIMKSMRTL